METPQPQRIPDQELDAIKAELEALPLPVSVDAFLDTPHLDHEQKTLRQLILEGRSDIIRTMMNVMWLAQVKRVWAEYDAQCPTGVFPYGLAAFLTAPHTDLNGLSIEELIEQGHGPAELRLAQSFCNREKVHNFEQPASEQWPTREEILQWEAIQLKPQKTPEEIDAILTFEAKGHTLHNDLATMMDSSFVIQWLYRRSNEAFGGKIPWEGLKDGSITVDDLQAMFHRLATGMPT